MATTRRSDTKRAVEYPTSDGKPMAETDVHRRDMVDLITSLEDYFAADPQVYVSGNLMFFYEEGNRRKHIAPDVFVVRGVPKLPPRKYYLLWEERRAPDLVIELTSKSTQREDRDKKRLLYRDRLRVSEYFLFDPFEEYLKPSMQGYRLEEDQYIPIGWQAGRLPSAVLGLHLERRGSELRLYHPATGQCLPTPKERAAEEAEARRRAEEDRQREAEARRRAEEDRQREAEARQRAEQDRQREAEARQRAEQDRQQIEAENERLRQELAAWQRRASGEA